MIELLLALAVGDLKITTDQVSQIRSSAPSIRAAFDEQMLDYPSARFRDVRVSLNADVDEPKPYLCGFVNGKNRMGAYVGWQPFVATDGLLVIGNDEFNSSLVATSCDGAEIVKDESDRSDWLRHR